MWRREDGLAYWLKKTHNASDLTHKAERREKLRRKIWARSYKKSVQDCTLDIHSPATVLGTIPDFPVDIKNGLVAIPIVVKQPDRKDQECIEATAQIHSADLMGELQVCPLKLPNEDNVQVRQALLTLISYCRIFMIRIGPAGVHIPASVQLRPPRTGGAGALIPRIPSVKSMMSNAYDIPIRQASIDIELLSDSEKRAYLQEAELKRNLPADECELIAVFPRVPIEMISRLHFLNEEKAIVYTISRGLNRSRTRIYDVMVVRDGLEEVHLIPHSTRNRMVFLN